MPRTAEDIVRDMLGRQAIRIAELMAENESMQEQLAVQVARIAELEAQLPAPTGAQ